MFIKKKKKNDEKAIRIAIITQLKTEQHKAYQRYKIYHNIN